MIFSSWPLCEVRFSSTASTSASVMPRVPARQQMIQKIARFRDQPAFILLHRREPGFDCLFTQFLSAMSNALSISERV